jgi:F-type H+-transporting ATPase subunit b
MGDTLQVLGIQWPKLLAQLLNFSIVLAVLWWFAYRPVFAMLEARRQKIAEGLANAEKIRAELAKTEAERNEILARAGEQADKLVEEARAVAAQDHARMLAELKHEIGRLVVRTTAAVADKVLTPDDQRRLAEETAKQLAA